MRLVVVHQRGRGRAHRVDNDFLIKMEISGRIDILVRWYGTSLKERLLLHD